MTFKGRLDKVNIMKQMGGLTKTSALSNVNVDFSTASNGKHFYTTIDVNGVVTYTEWI